MTLGSSAPVSLCEEVLAIMDRLCMEGIARDGLRPRDAVATGALTFAGNTITRASGSWIDDGLSAGGVPTVSGTSSNDGAYGNVIGLTDAVLTLRTNIVFVDEVAPAGTVVVAHPETSFALYYGTQWNDAWTGPNKAWFRVSTAERVDLKTMHTGTRSRTALDCFGWRLEVRIWGPEPTDVEQVTTYRRDVMRMRPAYNIFENVARVIRSRGPGYVTFAEVQGWQDETAILRHGEELFFAAVLPIPIYDYQKPALPSGLKLLVNGAPTVVAPGDL